MNGKIVEQKITAKKKEKLSSTKCVYGGKWWGMENGSEREAVCMYADFT